MDESEGNFSFDSLEMKDEAKKLGKMRMTISFRTETPDEVLNLINFPAIQVLNSSRMQQIHRLFSWHRHWVRDAFIKFANFQFNARITRRFHIKLLCKVFLLAAPFNLAFWGNWNLRYFQRSDRPRLRGAGTAESLHATDTQSAYSSRKKNHFLLNPRAIN